MSVWSKHFRLGLNVWTTRDTEFHINYDTTVLHFTYTFTNSTRIGLNDDKTLTLIFFIFGLLPQRRLWTIELYYIPDIVHSHSRSFCSNSFSNRMPYQIIAHFLFVWLGHIDPSLSFGNNLLKEVNRKIVTLKFKFILRFPFVYLIWK